MEAIDGLASTMSRFLGIRLQKERKGEAVSQRKGDAPAMTANTLVERYREIIFAYAVHRVNGQAQAEDVAAETFAAAFQSLGRCPALPAPDANPADTDPAKAWLLGIARRKVADHHRRQMRRRETSLDSPALNVAHSTDGETQPETTTLRNEAGRTIQQVMDALKAEHKEVLLLKYVEDHSVAEIALLVGRSENAVSSLLQRARAAALTQGRDYFLGEERGKR